MTIVLPSAIPSAINTNFRTATDYDGDIELRLNWVYLGGQNTEFEVKVNVTVIDSSGNSYVSSNNSTISTFNLLANDIRSTPIINLLNIGQDTLIDIVIMRNYTGSSDPQTETISAAGIELVM